MNHNIPVSGGELKRRLAADAIFHSIGILHQNDAAIIDGLMPATDYGFFLSGLSRTYTELGLPDEGNITADMMVEWAGNLKASYPERHLVVDIDEGLGPLAFSLAMLRDLRGLASAVQFDDQDPHRRRCGHLDGKVVLPLKEYTDKLERFLDLVGDDILVIARTDSPDFRDALKRAKTFSDLGAPVVLVDGLAHPDRLRAVRDAVGPDTAVMFNYVQGGKSAPITGHELASYGCDLFNFSFPFMLAHMEVTRRLARQIVQRDGFLPVGEIGLEDVVAMMQRNHDKREQPDFPVAAAPRRRAA